jgi:tetratricopeptide (TPR) repeat protein
MHIDIIDKADGLAQLRRDWDEIYVADPDAQYFLSWDFMSLWLPKLGRDWLLLAARASADASRHVAFLPLRLRLVEDKEGGFHNEITMAGKGADYSGILCAPEVEGPAVRAFAERVGRLAWANLHLENFRASEERVRRFLSYFHEQGFVVEETQRINKLGNVDLSKCPYVTLPGDWESYLNNSISAKMRRTIKGFMKQVENSDEFRITHAESDTIERDVKILLRFWALKWGRRKGERLQDILSANFTMLKSCFESGSLFLPVFWKGDTPLGAQARFIDPVKKSLRCYMGGRDEAFDKPSPGVVLHAHCIKYAIENGLTTYDFMRGDEAYKYSFGAKNAHIRFIVVSTKDGRNRGGKLDRRSLAETLHRATKYHQGGRLTNAERGYRQILDVDSRCPEARYRLGQLMATKGEHDAAATEFEALAAIKPDFAKAWARLGNSLEACGRFADAAVAYRELIKRQPDLSESHMNLGRVLVKLGAFDDAIVAFEHALRIQPDDAEAEAARANALYRLGTLSPATYRQNAELNVDGGAQPTVGAG